MKNVHFYLDHETTQDKRQGHHTGNVTAVFTDTGRFSREFDGNYGYDAVGAVYSTPNSPVASTSVSITWMQTKGKRISEAEARTIHPCLFASLDEDVPESAS
jgi:hypothetical protein